MSRFKSIAQALSTAASAPDDLAPDLTLKELVEAHEMVLPHKQLGPRLRKWVDAFSQVNAWSLTTAQLTKASNEMIRQGYAGGSVNRDIGAIGQLFAWAIKRRRIAPIGFISPTIGVPRHPESMRRVFISDEELKQLKFLARTTFPDKRFGLFVAMLADSGCRKSEVLTRRWSDLDIEGRRMVLDTTKNGDSRTLFFSAETVALAAKLKPKTDSLIFEGKRGSDNHINYRAAWQVLTKMIGREDIHMHDLRHQLAASLLEQGVTIGVASQILGHRDQTMILRRYGHLETAHLSKVMDARFV